MLATNLEEYRRMQVHTASGVNLVIMMLDGALKHLGLAQSSMKSGDLRGATASLDRVFAVLAELSGSLNFEAGEIAVRLFRLYEYCGRRINEATLRKDPAMLETVRDILLTLRQAWVETCRMNRGRTSPRRAAAPVPGFQVVVE